MRKIENLLETVTPLLEENIPHLVNLASCAVSKGKNNNTAGRKRRHNEISTSKSDNENDEEIEYFSNVEDFESEDDDDIDQQNSEDEHSDTFDSDVSSSYDVGESYDENNSSGSDQDRSNKPTDSLQPEKVKQSSKRKQKRRTLVKSDKSKKTKLEPIELEWHDVNNPPYIIKFGDSETPSKGQLHEITVHNGFSERFIEDSQFTLCSPPGFAWIAKKLGDPEAKTRFSEAFNSLHESVKDICARLCGESSRPIIFDKAIVFVGFEGFLDHYGSMHFFSYSELDNLVFAEFGEHLPSYNSEKRSKYTDDPFPSHEAKMWNRHNGYGEKLCIAAVTASGLLNVIAQMIDEASSHKDNPLKSNSLDVNYALVTEYTTSAIYYLERLAVVSHSLCGVKGGTLLLYILSCGVTIEPAINLSGLVVRMSLDLGLHRKESYANLSELEQNRRKAIWWGLYCCEKDLCMKLSRPSCILDKYITVGLPDEYLFIGQSENQPFRGLEAFVKLHRLWAKVNDVLMSPNPNSLSTKEIISSIISFDKELVQWKESLPPEFRPDKDFDLGVSLPGPPQSEYFNWMFKSLLYHSHCTYYYILNAIHRQISTHPSWIYKVTACKEDEAHSHSSDHSNNEKTIKKSSSIESPSSATAVAANNANADPVSTTHSSTNTPTATVASKCLSSATPVTVDSDCEATPKELPVLDTGTVYQLLKEAQKPVTSGKRPRTYVKNGVKLTIRKAAYDYPRVLDSSNICLDTARKTIKCLINLRPWTYAPLWRLNYFSFNSFIYIYLSIMMNPYSASAMNDIYLLEQSINVFRELSNHSKTFLHGHGFHPLLEIMTNALSTYAKRKRLEHAEPSLAPKSIPINNYLSKSRAANGKYHGQTNSKREFTNGATSVPPMNEKKPKLSNHSQHINSSGPVPSPNHYPAKSLGNSEMPNFEDGVTPNFNSPFNGSPSSTTFHSRSPSSTMINHVDNMSTTPNNNHSVVDARGHDINNVPLYSQIQALNNLDQREPILNYMYPESELGIDPATYNSLFLPTNPWTGLDFLDENLLFVNNNPSSSSNQHDFSSTANHHQQNHYHNNNNKPDGTASWTPNYNK